MRSDCTGMILFKCIPYRCIFSHIVIICGVRCAVPTVVVIIIAADLEDLISKSNSVTRLKQRSYNNTNGSFSVSSANLLSGNRLC